MKNRLHRILSLLLVLVLVGGMIPAIHSHADSTEQSKVLTDEDYAIVNDVFAQIDAMEDAPAKKSATRTQLTDAAAAIVMASENYVEGSLERNGNSFTWWTDEGIRCIYNPYLREKYANMKAPSEAEPAGIYNEPKATKGGWPSGNQVYLIAPYYGIDDSFSDQYKNEAKDIAAAIGDTDGYTLYSGTSVTVDNVATAVANGAVVIFDSHGTTDYEGSYVCDDPDGYEVYDYVSQANYSYLCLTNKSGLTTEDYNDGATYFTDSDGYMCACVNGAAIANHMEKNSPAGLLWMAICLGMATDTFSTPLREKGVEVVYGYSQSVTFAGDYCFEDTFWDNMIDGKNVATSIAAMKSEWGEWDWSEEIADAYGYYGSGYTLSEAQKYRSAFPVVVSDEDAHPGQRGTGTNYGACSLQTVKSTYTLYSQYQVDVQVNNTGYGSASVSGNVITATPAVGYFAQSATVVSGSATVSQSGNSFTVMAESDCVVQINFAPKTAVTVSFSGATVAAQSGYAGDSMSLPTVEAPEGFKFIGWTTEPLRGDTTEKPAFYTDSFIPTGNTTLYALYSYMEKSADGGTGDYVKITETPADWSGEYVIVYEAGGLVLNSSLAELDSEGNGYSVTISDSTISAAEGDPYKVTIAEMDGGYSIMTAAGTYISGTSGANKLNTGATPDANTIAMDASGNAVITSNTSVLRFNTDASRFRYYKSSSYSNQKPIALYVKDGTAGITFYTSNPTVCEHTNTSAIAAVAPTCTEIGYTAGVQCNDCGNIVSGHEVVDALGHSVGEGSVTIAATCTTDGVMSYVCTTCGIATTETIPATGHSYVADGVTYTCSVCGDSYTLSENTTLQYVFSDYTAGTQYAQGENHTLDDVVTLTINGAHLNTQIRLYAGSNVVFTSQKEIDSIVVQAGNKAGTLNVYSSADGDTWELVAAQATTTSYTNYSFDIPDGCKYVKLESVGAQIRVSEMTIVVLGSGTSGDTPTQPEPSQPENTVADDTYVIHTSDNFAMTTVAESELHGYLPAVEMTVEDDVISGLTYDNVFILTYTENGYTIEDQYGRFLYMTGTYNSFNVSEQLPSAGAYWNIVDNGDGTYAIVNVEKSKTIAYASTYGTFGAYTDVGSNDADLILTPVFLCEHTNTSATTVAPTCTTAGSETVVCDDCNAILDQNEIPATGHDYELEDTTYTCSVCGDSYEVFFVSFSVPNSVTAIDKMEYVDGGITLPSAGVPSGDQEYVFAGWVEEKVDNSTTKPNIYAAGSNYEATEAVTLYALYTYAVKGEGGTGDYVKVTEAPADWSGEYVIVYESGKVVFDSSLSTLDANNNNASVTISDHTIAAEEAEPYKVVIEEVDEGYSILTASGKYIGATGNSNSLNSSSSTAYANTLSLNSDGSVNVIGSGGAYLRYNTSASRFRYYKSSTYTQQKAIALYVKDGGSGTLYYTTVIGTGCSHSYGEVVTAPTCTEAGYTTYTCSACGDSYVANEVAALGHTEVVDAAVAATLSSIGLTQGSHCGVCDEVIVEQQVTPCLASVNSWGIVLSDQLVMKFKIYVEANTAATANIAVSVADSEVFRSAVAALEKAAEANYYYVYVNMAAAQMADAITLQITNGEDSRQDVGYTVEQYANTLLSDSAYSRYHAVVKEMLNYGAAAQSYFAHNTGNVVTVPGSVGAADVPDSADQEMVVSSSISGVQFYGASLVHRDKIAVRFYFTGDVTGCTFTVGDQVYTPVVDGDKAYVEIGEILPQDLDLQITLTVQDAEANRMSVTYGPMNYIVRMSKTGSDPLKILLKALYNYHLAAKSVA